MAERVGEEVGIASEGGAGAEDPYATVVPPARAPGPPVATPASPTRPILMVGVRGHDPADFEPLLRRRLPFLALTSAMALVAVLLALDLPKALSSRRLVAEDGRAYLMARGTAIAVLLGVLGAFRLDWPRSLGRLRVLEAAYMGAMCAHFGWLMWHELHDPRLPQLAEFPGGSAGSHSIAWFCLIVFFGVFIPNPWRRCAAGVALIAACPLIVGTAASLADATIRAHVVGPFLIVMVVWLAVATSIVTYASYRVGVLRHEASEARKLGQYRLTRRLGAGGMGEVYLGEHRLLRRPCAVKLIRPERAGDSDSLRRFEREVHATASLTHWNTVRIFDYGHAEDGTFYYVMEYLTGPNLEELVRRHGPLPPGRAVHLLRQVCHALREAHAVGLIHRDVKPGNILVGERGRVGDVVTLLDFGLVRAAAAGSEPVGPPSAPDGSAAGIDDAGIDLTAWGAVTGTPSYMAPEQAAGHGTLDGRADLYAVGAVGYFLLVGRPPFVRPDVWQVLAAHVRDPVVPLSHLQPGVPADLEAVILCCLAKDPDARFRDAGALADALGRCACAGEWTEAQATAWWLDSPPVADDAGPAPVPTTQAPTTRTPIRASPGPKTQAD